MKTRLAIVFFCLCGTVVGCDPAPPGPSTEPAPKAPEPPVTKVADPAPVAKSDDKKPGDNQHRIYQLRELERATVIVNGKKIETWLMDTEQKGQEGLMWLIEKDIKDDQGGLFVYKDAAPRSFWMQNTLIPLDIIYIGADGKVVSIAHGKPLSEESLPSQGPAMYVLELKGGRAQMFGIRSGVQLTIPKNATNKDG